MDKVYNKTSKIVVNSTFHISTNEYLLKYSQHDLFDKRALLLNRQEMSIRQLSEWEMRMVEGSFRKLKYPLLFEKMEDRKVILRLMAHLYNFQTTQVGINQIMNSYMKNWVFWRWIDNCKRKWYILIYIINFYINTL